MGPWELLVDSGEEDIFSAQQFFFLEGGVKEEKKGAPTTDSDFQEGVSSCPILGVSDLTEH